MKMRMRCQDSPGTPPLATHARRSRVQTRMTASFVGGDVGTAHRETAERLN